MTTAQRPECDSPAIIFGEIIEEIRDSIANQPRSLQTVIGPSEIGESCSRALLHKLAGTPEPAGRVPWQAWVGTQMHSGLEQIMANSLGNRDAATPRYALEQKVMVGTIDGAEIWGSCDCFDIPAGVVLDWKTASKSRMTLRRRHGPGAKYRAQAHLYGRGWRLLGFDVVNVMNVYLPRDGQFDEIFYWAEPFDEQIAVDALDRCTGLAQLLTAYGLDTALALYPERCDDVWCSWCSPVRPPLRRAAPTLSAIRSS